MKDKDFNYGLICNSSCNIGDEIQSIAAARFLPHIDTYVHREQVNRFKSDKKTKLIMNAWWTRLPKTFPPSKDIIPLLISMHFKHQLRKKTPMPGYTVYFKKYGPVGCRDKATAKWLNDNGIPAYFSGCLTLTLQRNPSLKREDYILGVDLPKHIVKEIKSRTNRPVYNIPRTLLPLNLNKRFRLAKTMLYLYHNAHCVVTSRLHAAMPCLAFETPVLMLDTKNNWLRRDGRYDGLMELCNIVTEDDFMNNNILGDAGKKLVIEDFLQGTEISILAAVSVTPELAAAGKACIVPFLPARDHKRLNDGAKGPNTGGMGAVCPVTDITEKQLEDFHHCILQPTVNGMIAEQMDYRGFIFFGLMMTADGPKLLEYNVRLGDPETQAVLPLMDCDFAALCSAIIDGKLQDFPILWKPGFNCAPVAVSGGYPGKYAKGIPISFNDTECDSEQVKIFIAGAQEQDGMLVTSGGRVLAVCSHGDTFEQAHKQAYQALQSIHFDGMFYRKDIGLPGAADSI